MPTTLVLAQMFHSPNTEARFVDAFSWFGTCILLGCPAIAIAMVVCVIYKRPQ